jgi:hypothetical protein
MKMYIGQYTIAVSPFYMIFYTKYTTKQDQTNAKTQIIRPSQNPRKHQ